MANPEHLKILKQGVEVWNKWREENPEVRPDLSGEKLLHRDFKDINLRDADCSNCDFTLASFNDSNFLRANLIDTILIAANFTGAYLSHALLDRCDLRDADLTFADLSCAYIGSSNFLRTRVIKADLSFAVLSHSKIVRSDFNRSSLNNAHLEGTEIDSCNFEGVTLIETNLTNAKINDTRVFGISSWKVAKEGITQRNLKITPIGEPEITVDDLEVAQFIYLMLNNEKIRDVIETITSKAVLILGRFTEERKAVLDAIKDNLRKHQGKYLPIVFDFEGPVNQKMKDTVILLARMSKFIIVDVSDPSSAPYEIGILEQSNIKVPIQPIIQKPQQEFSMLPTDSPFLPIYRYDTQESLLENIATAIIEPAERAVKKSRKK